MSARKRLGRFGIACVAPLTRLIMAFSMAVVFVPIANRTAISQISGLNEIIVTARKREETLQTTPLAVTAVTGVQLERRNFRDLTDIGRYTPNMVFDAGTGNTGGSSNAQIFIRGVGQTDFLFSSDPGVGLYLDGVFYPRATGIIQDLVDLERVEVLRGPQGTLFGKNTIGGAINVISKMPEDEFSVQGGITAGSRDRIDLQGVVNVPLIENVLAARVSASIKNQDGYVERPLAGDDLGDVNSNLVRALVEFTPNEDWTFLLSGDWTKKEESAIANELVFVGPADPLANPLLALWNTLVAPTTPLGVPYDNSFLADDFTTNGTGPNFSNFDMWGTALTVTWDINDNLTAKSITAYREQESEFGGDQDQSPLTYLESTNDNEHDQFSQELQLVGNSFDDRLDWVIGGFYMHESGSDVFDVILGGGLFNALESLPGAVIPLGPFPCPTLCAGGAGNPFNVGFDLEITLFDEIEIDSYAAFTQGTFSLTDQLSVTGGLRYTYEEKEFTTQLNKNAAGVTTLPRTTIANDWNDLSWRGGLEYQWTPDLLTYVSVAKGFKSGGFNGRAQSLAEIDSFDPETIISYEVGVKSEWLDNRLIVNIAAFFSDYEDLQLTSVRDVGGLIVVVTENVGQAEIKGFELEFVGLPVPELELRGGFGYINAEYTELAPGASVSIDDKFPNTPEWTANFAFDYTVPLNSSGSVILSGDVTYRSKYFNEPTNLELVAQDGFALLGAKATYRSPDEHWEISLFGTNLGDERYITNGLASLGSFGSVDASFGRPREWGVAIKALF